MSEFGTVEWALDQPIRSPGAKLILALLAKNGAADGVSVTVMALARQAGLERRSVGRHLAFLVDRGWLSRIDNWRLPTFILKDRAA